MALCAQKSEPDYLRIHILANSSDSIDQMIKYEVKDAIVVYLEELIGASSSKEEAIETISNRLSDIASLSNHILKKNGFSYRTKVSLGEENFPTRIYEGVTMEAGIYDTLIVELGDGKGENWWCVVYPPLCYSGEKIVYKSYLYELIKGYLT